MLHHLKTLPEFFNAVLSEDKTFEVRRNDRNFQLRDWLHLREWTGETFTGRDCYLRVCYLTDFQQQPGYVVMGIKLRVP